MDHVLDNPAWNALISGNKHLANGSQQVKYFDKEVSPFVGLIENTPENLLLLHHTVPYNGPLGFINPVPMEIPGNWKILQTIPCLQMIHEDVSAQAEAKTALVTLTAEHIPQMLALTKLTAPGPFAERTIEFGHYTGVFDGDKLVAMAGQRLHVFDYAEISAVCTHPDYLGRGYARQLLLHQANRIKNAKGIPYLHVRNDNERAIKVYQDMGFVTRREMHFYIMMKANA
jgi:ribosomal protein S18 acetylase RimI-like enzyme